MTLPQTVSQLVAEGDASSVFELMEQKIGVPLGVVVFSCSVFDLDQGQSRRIYTNRADLYPVSGLKQIIKNRWTETVLDRREPFVAKSADELVDVFPDHAFIRSIDCGAIINLPVICSGRFLGTVNLLRRPEPYSQDDLIFAQDHNWLAQIAFLMASLEAKTQN